MDNKWPPSDWTKATRADWDRLAEKTCREGQARFDRMTDEDWLKEIEQEPEGPMSMSPAHFLSLFPHHEASQPPSTPIAHREGAMSRLGSWIAKKLALSRGNDIRHS